jgi:hypothetical protein
MFEQNEAVKAMTDEQLVFTLATADKKTFLHFQAQREFNARNNGGSRKAVQKEDPYNYYLNGGQ